MNESEKDDMNWKLVLQCAEHIHNLNKEEKQKFIKNMLDEEKNAS